MNEARIAAALLNATWQSALVVMVAAVAVRLHGRTSARVRCAIWCAVLFIVAALPAVDFLQARTVFERVASPARVAGALARPTLAAPVRLPVVARVTAAAGIGVSPRFEEAAEFASFVHRTSGILERAGGPIVWVWLGIASVFGLRLLCGLATLALMRRKFTGLQGNWFEAMPRFANLPVYASDGVGVPCLIGLFRPAIVIPRTLVDELSPDDLRRIVLHEATHAQRGDHWVNLIVQSVRAALFFNPIVHLVAARIAVEREIACDDRVVELSGDRVVYAACLSALARTVSLSHAHAVPGFFSGRAQIVVRIEQLLDGAHDGTSRLSRRSAFALISLAALACILVQFGVPVLAIASRPIQPRRVVPAQPRVRVAPVRRVARAAPARSLQSPSKPLPRALPIAPRSNKAQHTQAAVHASVKTVQERTLVVAALPGHSATAATAARTTSIPQTTAIEATTSIARTTSVPMTSTVSTVAAADTSDDPSDSHQSSFIDELAAAGYRGLSVDQLIALRDHGVSGNFIAGLRSAGYSGLSVDDLIRLRDHGVSVEDVQSFNAMARHRLSVDELVTLRDHGVGSKYASELAAAGVSVPFDQLVTLRDHGVDPSFVSAMRAAGYGQLSSDQLVELRDHGVGPSFPDALRSAGYTNLSVDDLIRLRDHGVNGAFVQRVRHYFNGLPSVDDLIRLRDAGE